MMLPIDHEPSTMEKYWGRCLKGTISQKMSWVMAMMPPPPMPCTQRPMSMTVKSCASAQKAVPKVKETIDARSSRWRPKEDEAPAITGWKTAEVRRYEVPVQNVSAVDPWSECDISYVPYVSGAIERGSSCTIAHRQSRHQDRSIERDHKGHKAQADHDEPLLALWLPYVQELC